MHVSAVTLCALVGVSIPNAFTFTHNQNHITRTHNTHVQLLKLHAYVQKHTHHKTHQRTTRACLYHCDPQVLIWGSLSQKRTNTIEHHKTHKRTTTCACATVPPRCSYGCLYTKNAQNTNAHHINAQCACATVPPRCSCECLYPKNAQTHTHNTTHKRTTICASLCRCAPQVLMWVSPSQMQ